MPKNSSKKLKHIHFDLPCNNSSGSEVLSSKLDASSIYEHGETLVWDGFPDGY